MNIDPSQLHRFQLGRTLGEGADMEVFAATDIQTGRDVVVKRPHPALVERSQHADVEARIARALDVRRSLGVVVPWLPELIAYTGPASHDGYFGDALDAAYSVVVEDRARGLPLVGSAVDAIKRQPVGLPLNLFVHHPLAPRLRDTRHTVQRIVLEAAETVYAATGLMLMDTQPQNVFFDPATGAVRIIDIGAAEPEMPAVGRHGPRDVHDFFLEFMALWVSPAEPPEDPREYALPGEVPMVPEFQKAARALGDSYERSSLAPLRESAVAMIDKARARGYQGFAEFRQEFEELLAALEGSYDGLSRSEAHVRAWYQALDRLYEGHWRKFLFDPEADLAAYEAGRPS